MFTIYFAYCRPEERVYVGRTKQMYKRKWAHLNRTDYSTPLHVAIRKHGADSFDWGILSEIEEESKANEMEMLWIACLGARTELGYNIAKGGVGGAYGPVSTETRRKRSESLKKAHAEGRFPYLGGWTRHHSEETRAKIASTLRARYKQKLGD